MVIFWICVSYYKKDQLLKYNEIIHPWDFPGKSTGGGCHCLLRYNIIDTPIRMAKIQNTDTTKCWLGCGTTGVHCLWNWKIAQPLWKTVWQFKLNIFLPYDPVIMLLCIYQSELKTYVHTKTCTQVFIADLFIIAKT